MRRYKYRNVFNVKTYIMDKLYDYLFHYNPYEEIWYAFKRGDKEKYFNGEVDKSKLLKAKNIKVLLDVITKKPPIRKA